MYTNNSLWIFKIIINKLLNYINYVKKKYKYTNTNINLDDFKSIYFNKTYSRLDDILKNKTLKNIYNKEYIFINWIKYKNIKKILNKKRIVKIIEKSIFNINDISIIHGDLCFSNILFDINSWIFKLIDPRWKFWKIWIYWDLKYDIAKLRHSINWNYESIIYDLYNLEYDNKNSFNFSFFNWNNYEIIEYFDKKILKLWYDIEVIKFIEGLLFISMIPLHLDSLDRQILMYIISVKLFNETKLLW